MTLRVGVVGAGFGERIHVPALRRAGCRVEWICSAHAGRAAAAARRARVGRWFDDWRRAVRDPRTDAVAIAVPPERQAAIAIGALRAGKAVFCEKPLAVNLVTARRLAAAARASRGRANTVDFELPEAPEWRKTRELLKKGRIGRLRHFDVRWDIETYACRERLNDSWKTRSGSGGGALSLFVSHSFHYAEWFGGPLREISCRLFSGTDQPGPSDTLVRIAGTFRSGAAFTLSMSIQSFLGTGHRLSFYGSGGTLILENTGSDYVRGFELRLGTRRSGAFRTVSRPRSFPREDGRIVAVASLAKRFARWANGGARVHPDLADGLRVQTLLEAAHRSNALDGRRVRV